MTSRPLRITVVTPSYNQAPFLERTLQSVLTQEYPDLEYIVLDGGSTDGSVDILRRYESRLSFWHSGPDGGQTAALNSGWRQAHGDILAWLNSDDYYCPGALRAVADEFASNPAAWLVYGTCEYVRPDGSSMGFAGEPFSMRTMLYSHDVIPQPSAFIRREAFLRLGPLDESLNYSMDFDFFLRIASESQPVFLPQVMACATIHPLAKTTKDRHLSQRETHLVRLRHAPAAGRLFISIQPILSRIFHGIPQPVRVQLNRFRPRRLTPQPRRR